MHVCYSFILSGSMYINYICTRPSAMYVTIASGHFPCLSQLHLTNSDICKLVPTSMHVLTHLHRTSVHICYSNIQPSVVSVALATDQRSSNGCYNGTGQAGLYQPAVKMETDICNMQIPYSGVVFVLICYTP